MTKTLTINDLDALFHAFNSHDLKGVMSYLAQNCIFEGAAGADMWGKRFETHESISAAFAAVFTSMPDSQWKTTGHFIAGDRAVTEFKFTATQADGQRIEADGVDIFTHADGLITYKKTFRKQRPLLPPL